MDKKKEQNNSLEQEQKKQAGKEIEPQRDPVKPQEENPKE
ncbi:3-methyladenine DNA glycosylase [Neobacillus piezotolerans]|uniref:3-methyladenine DNA glycosylase n=1 Tax=Neobacillus piezotolerans TaxID=2259171 RepID=A0A3D8GV35_9BACI|nr:3-methyladenine DNA glycosylase [Neobacillus piezotolerans]RDU38343.1 3-methyladenine DNA glycosylase [Neobacillus piezotolerans]